MRKKFKYNRKIIGVILKMSKDLLTVEDADRLAPESLTVANNYLMTNDIGDTANALGIGRDKIVSILNRKEVRRYIDHIFLEQGYFNRSKIAAAMTDIIEKKLEELEDAEMSSTKDIADLLQMAHKMRMDELKVIQAGEKEDKAVKNQTNIQNNFSNDMGSNYNSLLKQLSTPTES